VLTLVLTRHGLTPRSDPEQHLGQRIDIELSPAGQAQAVALAVRLEHIHFERILTSPLVRARETASIIAQRSPGKPPIEPDPRLREMDYGHWEGLTYPQIDARDLAERQAWEADPARIPCPGGESGDDVAARVSAFLVDLLAAHATHPADATERPVLAVAHSSLNRILVCVALGIAIREFRLRLQQSQANLTALRFEHGSGPGDARLILLNDLAHLRRPPRTPWK
jgi:probable phosphoglycerate mutase